MVEQKPVYFKPTSNQVNRRILRRINHQRKNSILISRQSLISMSSLILIFIILLIPNILSQVNTNNTADFTSYTVSKSTVTIDGVVHPGEYSSYYIDPNLGVKLYSEHDANIIYFAIICPAAGWCAMGFNRPGVAMGMGKADIKFGMMVNGTLQLTDRYAKAVGAVPTIDPVSNIIKYAGTRIDGKTTFEFCIKLNGGTNGGLDQNLVIGNHYTVIYAFHNTDVVEYHGQDRNEISFFISPNKNS